MPSKSKAQQRFMGMVRATQKGQLKNPPKQIKKVAKDMKKKDVKDFASTKHEGLPEKVGDDKKKKTITRQQLRNIIRQSIRQILKQEQLPQGWDEQIEFTTKPVE